MSQTLEAVIDENGAVRLLKPIRLTRSQRALVTILDDQPTWNEEELDAGYRTMAEDEAREADALEWAEATIGDARSAVRSQLLL